MDATPPNAKGPWDDGGGAMAIRLLSSPLISAVSAGRGRWAWTCQTGMRVNGVVAQGVTGH